MCSFDKLADMSTSGGATTATTTSTVPGSKSISSIASYQQHPSRLLEEPDIRMSQLHVVSSSRMEHPLKLSPSLSPPSKNKPTSDGSTEIRIHTDASALKLFE